MLEFIARHAIDDANDDTNDDDIDDANDGDIVIGGRCDGESARGECPSQRGKQTPRSAAEARGGTPQGTRGAHRCTRATGTDPLAYIMQSLSC